MNFATLNPLVKRRDWWFPTPLTNDILGVGSSTMQGALGYPGAFMQMTTDNSGLVYYAPNTTPPSSGAYTASNKGQSAVASATILGQVTGATARQLAADCIMQFGGNWESGLFNPVPTVLGNAAAAATALGHTRFIHITKHNDTASTGESSSGGQDWFRLKDLMRELALLHPGRVEHPSLMFRTWPALDSADIIRQGLDQIPPSLTYDTGHTNSKGASVLSRGTGYQRWPNARAGGLPYIPHQELLSTATTNQTSGGLVGVVQHDASISGTLTNVLLSVDNPEFSIAIESGAITLRRTSSTFLGNGYYNVVVTASRGSERRSSVVQVFLADVSSGSALYRTNLNSQGLTREGQITASQDTQTFSFVLGIKPLAGFDTALAANNATIFTTTGANTGAIIDVSQSSKQCRLRLYSSAPANIFQLYWPGTTQALSEANSATLGVRWCFGHVDTSGASIVYSSATDANTAVTTGASPSVGSSTCRISPNSNGTMNRVGFSLLSGTFPHPLTSSAPYELAALWVSTGLVDFTSTTGNRDLARDPVTKRSVLNTTRGGDAPGVINGVTPFLWMEGPPGNWAGGINLADPTKRWGATDRAMMSAVAA